VTDEASKLLAKAERALRAAEILLQSGDAESTTGRAYYAMFTQFRHSCANGIFAIGNTPVFIPDSQSTS
jgi:hypothetical protein